LKDPDRAGSPVIRDLYLGLPDVEDAGARWGPALALEARRRRDQGWPLAPAFRSIHVGGGCASVLDARVPGSLLEALEVALAPGAEWAVEFEPRRLSASLLEAWVAAGVSRIVLRPGTLAEVRGAAEVLDGAPGLHWSVDVEFGGPAAPGAVDTVARLAREFAVPHLSLTEADDPWDPDRVAQEYLEIAGLLDELGYRAWELSSFALPDHVPRHARAVWRGCPYMGLGPGAHSFSGGVRIWNLEPWEAYFFKIQQGEDPTAGRERPDIEARALEWLWSRLRLREGLALDRLPPAAGAVHERWVTMGWAHDDPSRLRLSERGWLLLDTLAVELASRLPAEELSPDPEVEPRHP